MTFDGVTVKYAGGRFLMNHRVYTHTHIVRRRQDVTEQIKYFTI